MTAPAAFAAVREDPPGQLPVVRLSGRLGLQEAPALWDALRGLALPARKDEALALDLSQVEAADGGAVALVVRLECELAARGTALEVRGAAGKVKDILQLYRERQACAPLHPAPDRQPVLTQVGATTLSIVGAIKEDLAFIGNILLAAGAALRRPSSVPWGDVTRVLERVGADGVPIVALLLFLVGLIIAFQSAVQLERFGATIYVADAVAVSITTELGPLMTAIIFAGRSGAAFAAELGTMRVSEEVDAIRTMGLCPYRFLVFPRILALTIAAPLLTVLADVVAISGGLLVGLLVLDQTTISYMTQTKHALTLWLVGQGLLKSAVFGLAVGLIACDRGLGTGGGAEGVGRSTTSAVVTSLFALVLLDAIFTVTFRVLGL